MYEEAIKKLKEMSQDNENMCAEIEKGEIKFQDVTQKQLNNMTKTYRYWFQCCLIAAWLLEESEKEVG